MNYGQDPFMLLRQTILWSYLAFFLLLEKVVFMQTVLTHKLTITFRLL